MKHWKGWIAFLLMAALITGCTNASSYVKESYQLVDVAGKGKASAKIYLSEGKTVPQTAQDIAAQEKPKEISKEDIEQMFLFYDNRIINVHKDPNNENNTLIEIDSIEYAKKNYDSSFLQGYMTAVLVQSLFGSDWSSSKGTSTYKGYGTSTAGKSSTSTATKDSDVSNPSTSDRTGSFSSKGSTSSNTDASKSSSGTSTTPSSGGSTGSFTTKPSTSSSSSSSKSSSSSSSSKSSSVRKSDGSTPKAKSSAPKTSSRSGGFSSKKR